MGTETIFDKILRKEIPAKIVFEDERAVAFRDVNPAAPVHILIVPRKSLVGISQAQAEDSELLGHLMLVAKKLAESEGIAESGYRLVVNSGPHAGQSVFQYHLHLIGGREMNWPPG